jgi:hypothetical protein
MQQGKCRNVDLFSRVNIKGHDHEALQRLPKPQSLRKGWQVYEAQEQASS